MSSLQNIGQELKTARQDRGLSLEEVARATRLSVRHLVSLEEGDESSLPEPFYIKSFIVKYANFLGLPGNELAARYWEEKKEVPVAQPPKEESAAWWLLPLVATLGLIFLVTLAWWFSQRRVVVAKSPPPPSTVQVATPSLTPTPKALPFSVATPSAIPSIKPSPRPSPTPIQKPSPMPTHAPTPSPMPTPTPLPSATASVSTGTHVLVVTAFEPCWVFVVADGKTRHSGLVQSGGRLRFQANRSLMIRLGNAGGVRLTLENRDLGVIGKTKEVVERTFTF